MIGRPFCFLIAADSTGHSMTSGNAKKGSVLLDSREHATWDLGLVGEDGDDGRERSGKSVDNQAGVRREAVTQGAILVASVLIALAGIGLVVFVSVELARWIARTNG